MANFIEIRRELFGAAEAEAVTGVPQAIIRDWERRDFFQLRKVAGRSVFETRDLALIMALGALTRIGIPIGVANLAAGMSVLPITAFAEAKCSVDDPNGNYLGHRPSRRYLVVLGTISREELPDKMIASVDMEGVTFVKEDRRGLDRAALDIIAGKVYGAESLDEFMEFCAEKGVAHESFYVIDHKALGERIAKNAPRPLVQIIKQGQRD